jgi:hypothetical protein
MTNADAKSVVDGFFKAWTTGDFEAAHGFLHDDLSFSGAIATSITPMPTSLTGGVWRRS